MQYLTAKIRIIIDNKMWMMVCALETNKKKMVLGGESGRDANFANYLGHGGTGRTDKGIPEVILHLNKKEKCNFAFHMRKNKILKDYMMKASCDILKCQQKTNIHISYNGTR